MLYNIRNDKQWNLFIIKCTVWYMTNHTFFTLKLNTKLATNSFIRMIRNPWFLQSCHKQTNNINFIYSSIVCTYFSQKFYIKSNAGIKNRKIKIWAIFYIWKTTHMRGNWSIHPSLRFEFSASSECIFPHQNLSEIAQLVERMTHVPLERLSFTGGNRLKYLFKLSSCRVDFNSTGSRKRKCYVE